MVNVKPGQSSQTQESVEITDVLASIARGNEPEAIPAALMLVNIKSETMQGNDYHAATGDIHSFVDDDATK